MRLSDFPLTTKNHFVAMEYYGLILNRTLLILLTDTHMIGMVANGIVSVKNSADPLTAIVTDNLSVQGDLDDPHSYLNNTYLKQAGAVDLLGNDLLKLNRANFRFGFDEISSVTYDPRNKWGMGHYPHDGKVYVTAQDCKREFIILGNQSGENIAGWIEEKAVGRFSENTNHV